MRVAGGTQEQGIASTPSSVFPGIIVTCAPTIIAICYTMSYSQGHTQAFPYTDITHTARYAPERYLFRIGLIVLGAVMFWNWHIVYYWLSFTQQQASAQEERKMSVNRRSNNNKVSRKSSHGGTGMISTISYLGYIGCFAIAVSSACISSNSDMPWTTHVIAATSFFILTLVAQVLTTMKCYELYYRLDEQARNRFMNIYSLYSKLGVSFLSIAVLLFNLVAQMLKMPVWTGNACEWILTLLILFYNASFCSDWWGRVYTNVVVVDGTGEDGYRLVSQSNHREEYVLSQNSEVV